MAFVLCEQALLCHMLFVPQIKDTLRLTLESLQSFVTHNSDFCVNAQHSFHSVMNVFIQLLQLGEVVKNIAALV